MQALSKSDDSVRLEFIAIADLVKIIAQLLNDTVVAAIVSTEESDRYFASFFKRKRKGTAKYKDRATTENNAEITNFIPPTVPSEDEIRKRNR